MLTESLSINFSLPAKTNQQSAVLAMLAIPLGFSCVSASHYAQCGCNMGTIYMYGYYTDTSVVSAAAPYYRQPITSDKLTSVHNYKQTIL